MTPCTIARSGQAAAKARMYLRLRVRSVARWGRGRRGAGSIQLIGLIDFIGQGRRNLLQREAKSGALPVDGEDLLAEGAGGGVAGIDGEGRFRLAESERQGLVLKIALRRGQVLLEA